MSKLIPGNHKHLSLEDRQYIEQALNERKSFRDISKYLCKDPTTISKEVWNNRIVDICHKGSFINPHNFCIHHFHCKKQNTIPDIKQKAMVALMYSSGLRIGEVCHLRYEDISRTHMRVHIRNSKSRDDRYAILSQKALDILTQYWQECDRPRGWLFPKQHDPDRPIDIFFLSWHIHEHEERLGWERKLTCHSFRHALGTHLYESGADLLTIKAILGHKSILSTTIYVHLASNNLKHVNNPFDSAGGVSNV